MIIITINNHHDPAPITTINMMNMFVAVSLEHPPLKLKEGRYIDFLVKRVIRWIVAITMPITAVAALG